MSRGNEASGISGNQTHIVEELSAKYGKPSKNDLFALTIAKSRGLILLSGDKDIRSAAKKEKVEVHGTIWILDQLVAEAIITQSAAAKALEEMLKAGARLPNDECQDRLRRCRG